MTGLLTLWCLTPSYAQQEVKWLKPSSIIAPSVISLYVAARMRLYGEGPGSLFRASFAHSKLDTEAYLTSKPILVNVLVRALWVKFEVSLVTIPPSTLIRYVQTEAFY